MCVCVCGVWGVVWALALYSLLNLIKRSSPTFSRKKNYMWLNCRCLLGVQYPCALQDILRTNAFAALNLSHAHNLICNVLLLWYELDCFDFTSKLELDSNCSCFVKTNVIVMLDCKRNVANIITLKISFGNSIPQYYYYLFLLQCMCIILVWSYSRSNQNNYKHGKHGWANMKLLSSSLLIDQREITIGKV